MTENIRCKNCGRRAYYYAEIVPYQHYQSDKLIGYIKCTACDGSGTPPPEEDGMTPEFQWGTRMAKAVTRSIALCLAPK